MPRSILSIFIVSILLICSPTTVHGEDHPLKHCPMSGDNQLSANGTNIGDTQRTYLERFLGTDLPRYVCTRTDVDALTIQRFFDVLTTKALTVGTLQAFNVIDHKDLHHILHGTIREKDHSESHNELEALHQQLALIFDRVHTSFRETQPEE